MSLEQIHPEPRIARFISENKLLSSTPFVLLDIGARGGCARHWRAFGNQMVRLGIEPDPQECQRLNSRGVAKERYLPYALWSKEARVAFHIAATEPSCSMFPASERVMGRFLDYELVKTIRSTELAATTLDQVAQAESLSIDFMKMDAEGAELEILKGGESTVNASVLGLTSEVFFQPWREKAPTFDQVHAYCVGLGFRLYDLATYRHVRRNFNLKTHQNYSSGLSPFGQMIWGEALYLRDPVDDIVSGGRGSWWSPVRILKTIALQEIFYLHDCAIELLDLCAERSLLPAVLINNLRNLIGVRVEDLATFTALHGACQRKRFGSVLPILDNHLQGNG